MEDKNKDKKNNMPKFNMTWVYVVILIALGLLFFTNNGGDGQTGGGKQERTPTWRWNSVRKTN